MTRVVKTTRNYRSDRRSEQAADTRRAVVGAARETFIADGWQKATIAAIAQRAGVSPETVYATFGNKRSLLEEAITAAVRGPEADTPLMQQAGPRSVYEGTNQSKQLERFAADIVTILERVAPMMAVLRTAAETDRGLASHYAGLHAGRRRNFEVVVDALLRNGPLRVDRKTAVDAVARLTSPELFLLATGVQASTVEDYRAWLRTSLKALLLP
jgi:AcrR family transcriptional regulator